MLGYHVGVVPKNLAQPNKFRADEIYIGCGIAVLGTHKSERVIAVLYEGVRAIRVIVPRHKEGSVLFAIDDDTAPNYPMGDIISQVDADPMAL